LWSADLDVEDLAGVERRWQRHREEAERRWRQGSGLRESNRPGDCGGQPELRGDGEDAERRQREDGGKGADRGSRIGQAIVAASRSGENAERRQICGGKNIQSKGLWVLGLLKTQTFQNREIVEDEEREAASRGGRERSRNS